MKSTTAKMKAKYIDYVTYNTVYRANAAAVFVHFVLFCVVLGFGLTAQGSGRDFHYALKRDMMQVKNATENPHSNATNVSLSRAGRMQAPPAGAGREAAGSDGAGQENRDSVGGWMQEITGAMVGIAKSAKTNTRRAMDEKGDGVCEKAEPNYVEFGSGDDRVRYALSTYAAPSGVRVNLFYLVFSFFLLSFAFQLLVYVPLVNGESVYNHMFETEQQNWSPLNINWLRYIEYSFSATVMLLAISLLAGINDLYLLLCIGTMCGSCMLMGLCAEWMFRIAHYLSESQSSLLYKGQIMMQCYYCAFLTHALGWLLLVVPWVVIIESYRQWWTARDCTVDGGRGAGPKPPEFVVAIIVSQGVLFLSFGLVQVYSFRFPKATHTTELLYIALSLGAKTVLGLLVAVNVFM